MPKTEPTLIFLSVSHFSLCWCDVGLCSELVSREVTTTGLHLLGILTNYCVISFFMANNYKEAEVITENVIPMARDSFSEHFTFWNVSAVVRVNSVSQDVTLMSVEFNDDWSIFLRLSLNNFDTISCLYRWPGEKGNRHPLHFLNMMASFFSAFSLFSVSEARSFVTWNIVLHQHAKEWRLVLCRATVTGVQQLSDDAIKL
ncbi:hypothetical protein J6590_063958 [Homalodisca vitripennis]|nr:hypothetical protein J6590_063958 [Homalodisca vitripennis]